MPFKSYLENDDGSISFERQDGTWLPRLPMTGASYLEKKKIDLQAQADPALQAAIPQAPSAMGPTALAANERISPEAAVGKVIQFFQPASPQEKAAKAKAEAKATEDQIAAAQARATANAQAEKERIAKVEAEEKAKAEAKAEAKAAPAAPTTTLSPGDPSKGLVPTPPSQAAQQGPTSTLNAAEQELDSLYKLQIREEMAKRSSPGTLVKGGKVQTREAVQGAVGPNEDTRAQLEKNALETERMQKLWAEGQDGFEQEKSKIELEQAGLEQEQAAQQAELAARKADALKSITDQAEALQKQISEGKIDSEKFWKDRGTGGQIAAAMAIAFGAIGNAIAGVNGPNQALDIINRAVDRNIDTQIKNIEKQRGDLSDLQRIYAQTKERFGDEATAIEAARLAGLTAAKAKIQEQAAKLDALQAKDPKFKEEQLREMAELEAAWREATGADTPLAQKAAELKIQKLRQETRSYSVKARITELGLERQRLEARAAMEERINGVLSREYGFTQDRVVGGSSGPSLSKIVAMQKARAEMQRGADNDAAKHDKEEPILFVDGRPVKVGKGASQPSVDRAQTRISYADDVLSIVGIVEADKKAGRYVPGDPVRGVDALSLANGMAQMAGGGVASESDKADAAAALNPRDPRHSDALERIRQRAVAAKINAGKSVGAKP